MGMASGESDIFWHSCVGKRGAEGAGNFFLASAVPTRSKYPLLKQPPCWKMRRALGPATAHRRNATLYKLLVAGKIAGISVLD